MEQEKSKIAHLAYRALMARQPAKVWQDGGLTTLLGYGPGILKAQPRERAPDDKRAPAEQT